MYEAAGTAAYPTDVQLFLQTTVVSAPAAATTTKTTQVA